MHRDVLACHADPTCLAAHETERRYGRSALSLAALPASGSWRNQSITGRRQPERDPIVNPVNTSEAV
jgi:hypothetical protein